MATSCTEPLPSLSYFCHDEEDHWHRWGTEVECWPGAETMRGIQNPSGTFLVSWISQNHFSPFRNVLMTFQLAVLSLGPHPGKFYQIHWVISCTYFRKPEIAGWDGRAPLGQIYPNTWLIKSLPSLSAFLAKQQQVYGGRWENPLEQRKG